MNKPYDPFGLSYANPQILPSSPEPLSSAFPFIDRGVGALDQLDRIDDLTDIQPFPGGPILPVQNIETDLRYLRSEMPFAVIIKLPKLTSNVFLPTANLAGDLNVPDGAVLGRFLGVGDYFVSHDGLAQIPSVANNGAPGLLYKPEFAWFYIGGVKQFSVVSPNANAFVQLIALAPNNWPKGSEGRGI